MMLKKVSIRNFRSIREMDFVFPDNNLLILVGHNNAGKSNIIRAIDLICGETWINPERLEDHDHYQRDRERPVYIHLEFDNGNHVSFSSGAKWPTYKDGYGQKIYSVIKDDFPCTYLAADRTLDKQTTFYDYSLIGKIRKSFHKRAKDVHEKIKGKYEEINKLYETVEGFKRFKEDFTRYFSEMQADTPVKLSLDFKPFTPSNYFKNMQILALDSDLSDQPLDVAELGEGSRNIILLSLLRSYAEHFKGGAGLLALEEPELFLHPQARRHLFKTLKGIAASGMQVIVSTHSSSFTDLELFESIGQVFKVPDEKLANRNHTKLRMVSRKELVDHCIATGVPGNKTTTQNITEFYRTISHPRTNEAFFARVIVLVEGDTEELALPIYLDALGFDCDLYGVSIISAGGKNHIPKYWRLLSKFNASIVVVFDADKKAGNNENLAKCFGIKVIDIEHAEPCYKKIESLHTPKTPLIIFKKNFEVSVQDSLTDKCLYTRCEDEAKTFIKPVNDQSKGQVARYVARKLIENSHSNIPAFIKDMLKEIKSALQWTATTPQ